MYLVVWLQSSTTKPQWFQHLKLVFLEILNVTTWSVFKIRSHIIISCSYIYIDHLLRLIILLSSCPAAMVLQHTYVISLNTGKSKIIYIQCTIYVVYLVNNKFGELERNAHWWTFWFGEQGNIKCTLFIIM